MLFTPIKSLFKIKMNASNLEIGYFHTTHPLGIYMITCIRRAKMSRFGLVFVFYQKRSIANSCEPELNL